MNIMIVTNFEKHNAVPCTIAVYDFLSSVGAQLLMPISSKPLFFRENISYDTMSLQMKRATIVLVIGGDGTIIHTAKYAALHSKPLLGIHAGRLGFLAELEQHEIHKLEALLAGNYSIEERMVLQAVHQTKAGETKHLAINDLVICKGALSRMIDLEVFCETQFVGKYRADGLIFATPTGSTAYALSAGGPIVQPSLHTIALTPIAPHALFDRTVIFEANCVLTVRPHGDIASDIFMTADGETPIKIQPEDQIILRKSKLILKMVHLSDRSFYQVLHKKFLQPVSDEVQ